MRPLLLLLALLIAPNAAVAQDYRFPTSSADYGYFYPTAYYDHAGYDWNCGSVTYSAHKGSDFGIGGFAGMDAGRDVVAAANGTVSFVNDGEFDRCTTGDCSGGGGFGNYVRIDHPDGKVTYYGHMKKFSILVAAGNTVTCGQKLGEAGSSGFSTGPHVHFEVRSGGVAYDPFDGPCSFPPSWWVSQGSYNGLPSLTCDAGIQSITVTAPSGGSYPVGTSLTAQWTSTGITGNVNVLVAYDDGQIWAYAVTDTPNDGNHPGIVINGTWDPTRTHKVGVESRVSPFPIGYSPTFTITVPAPSPASPGSSSEPGPEISTTTPRLSWSSVPYASGYGLYVSKYPYGAANVVYENESLAGTSTFHDLPSGRLVNGEKYRWNMRTLFNGVWSPYSSTLYFSTVGQVFTATPTATPTRTFTSTFTPTPTSIPSFTRTLTPTNTPVTPSPTRTNTLTTPAATATNTPVTPSPTRTNTSVTAAPTFTPTNTPTAPPTATFTPAGEPCSNYAVVGSIEGLTQPLRLSIAQRKLYAGSWGKQYVIDLNSDTYSTTVSFGPYPFASPGRGTAIGNTEYVPLSNVPAQVAMIDVPSNTVTGYLPLGAEVFGSASYNGLLYVTENVWWNDGTPAKVFVINPTNQQVISSINAGINTNDIAIVASRQKAYTADSTSATTTVINLNTNTASGSISLPINPSAAEGFQDTALIAGDIIGTQNGRVLVIDAVTDAVAAPINVGRDPVDLAVSNGRAFVTNQSDNTVSVLDLTTNGVVQTLTVGSTPTGIVADSVTGKIYVANQSGNSISVLNCVPLASACSNPVGIPPGGGGFTGSTSGSSTLNSSCGNGGTGPEKVFEWTPNTTGTATISTCGSNFDTVVYMRNGNCSNGTEVACNDDTCGLQSTITPSVTAGQTYYIIVDGFGSAAGDFTLTVTAPLLPSPTNTPVTPSATPTNAPVTPSPTRTITPVIPTNTPIPTSSPTATPEGTITATPTRTPTPTATPEGTPTVPTPPANTTIRLLDCATGSAGIAQCVVQLQLVPGSALATLQFNLSVVPVGAAPAVSTAPTFVADGTLPVPAFNENNPPGSGTVIVGWLSAISPALTGTRALGILNVVVPGTAQPGDHYALQVRDPSGDSVGDGNHDLAIAPGPDGTLTVGQPFLVCDVVPIGSDANGDGDTDDAGEFGNGVINNSDVVAMFRASLLPGLRPPVDSDRFSAMDAGPEDTPPSCGGNGSLSNSDVVQCFRRSLLPALARYRRQRGGGVCNAAVVGGASMLSAPAALRSAAPALLSKTRAAGIGTDMAPRGPRVRPSGAVIAVSPSAAPAGASISVEVVLRRLRGAPVTTLQLAVSISPEGAAAPVEGLQFEAAPGVPPPDVSLIEGDTLLLGWLQPIELPRERATVLGTLSARVPGAARAGDAYVVAVRAPSAARANGAEVSLVGGVARVEVGAAAGGAKIAAVRCERRRLVIGQPARCWAQPAAGRTGAAGGTPFWFTDAPEALSIEAGASGAVVLTAHSPGWAHVYVTNGTRVRRTSVRVPR